MTPYLSSIHTVGICGLGQMGAAGAVSFERAGYRVLLWGRDRAKLDAARGKVDELRAWMDRHTGPRAKAGGSIEFEADLARVGRESDMVMDAITEVMELKADLLQRLQKSLRPEAICTSTTSGLSITEMGRRGGCGERLVGAHFWNPPHLMPIVEVIRGEETHEPLMDVVTEVMRSLGKIPVRVNRDVPGFIGNRLQHAMWREALHLVESGVASAEDVDRVARLTFGLRLPAVGPMENMDLVGLDLVELIHDYLFRDLSNAPEPLPALKERVRDGKLGMKAGEGFYDWSRRDGKALIERRDRQIVQQLKFLKEVGAL